MKSYTIEQFYLTGDIFLENNYSQQEYKQYLEHFFNIPFSFDGNIKSLKFKLTINSNSRICNALGYDQSYDEILSTVHGLMPKPIAWLTLTLWKNDSPTIRVQKI